ncbi:MAG: FAD-binding oxidoreductase [Rhizobiales bacterium]|nr:FAD-binding oxidoreductase [Hyphomicrobiales bacterium]
MPYQSPISPGRSWYEDSVGERPTYPSLDGSTSADVAIVGGGYTGLSAAYHLARAGLDVVLIEQHRFGDGASGRNGGQLGTGQRAWAEELEAELGLERAKALFDLAEEAKAHLIDFAQANGIDIDYQAGQLSAAHKPRYVDAYRRHADIMAERFGYRHLTFLDRRELAAAIGSERYFGGVRDAGTGHIHPLKLLVGTARAAASAGARIHEGTAATSIARQAGRIVVTTPRGAITADRALVAVNAYGRDLEPVSAAHVMPIGSFIGATVPLPAGTPVLPGGEAVDDSRFVVRYFRKSRDNRLLFGGREVYSASDPAGIREQMRRQIAEVYPALAQIELTHAWGGSVGITMPRKPFVREVMPGVTSAGGWSGHGVMLSNFTGKLYAETITGNRDRLRLLRDLKVPPFPGGRRLRAPLLFLALNWFAFRDRI